MHGCVQPFVLRQWLHRLGRPRREQVLAEVMGLLQRGIIRPYSGAPQCSLQCNAIRVFSPCNGPERQGVG